VIFVYFSCFFRRFSSVQRGASEEASSSSSFVRRPGLRRFSSIAAIDSAKVPPTVGPPPAPDGGGCTEATSAAAVALLRCCRESDDAALHQLIAGADGLRLRPSDVNTFDASGRVSYVTNFWLALRASRISLVAKLRIAGLTVTCVAGGNFTDRKNLLMQKRQLK
jgi:hypothetical protein